MKSSGKRRMCRVRSTKEYAAVKIISAVSPLMNTNTEVAER